MLICKSMIIFLFHNRFIVKLKGSDISENGKVRTSENDFLCKNNEKTGKNNQNQLL